MIYILGVYIIVREVMHHLERRDLYNRIMATNYAEYKDKPVKNIKSPYSKGGDR